MPYSYNRDISDADIGHLSGKCRKDFRRPRSGTNSSTQLHELKMAPGMMAEDYTARLEMLMGRTDFNDAALKDIYVRGLPNSILQKIFTQVTLPNGLAA